MTLSHALLRAAGFALALLIGAGSATAQTGATPWSQGFHSRVRLLAGGAGPNGERRAGIEIRLDPGFKTYWRTPGSAGVPPTVDFAGSSNLVGARLRFPAPETFEDGAGTSWGYRDGVIFPVAVDAAEPGKPVRLAVKLDYAVCEKICIPAEASLALDLSPTDEPTAAELVAAAEARVPVRRPVGSSGPLTILGVERTGEDRYDVRVRTPPGSAPALFAEGAPGWYFDTGEATPGSDRIVLTVAEKPKGAPLAEAGLVLTLVTPSAAVESEARLDGGGPKP